MSEGFQDLLSLTGVFLAEGVPPRGGDFALSQRALLHTILLENQLTDYYQRGRREAVAALAFKTAQRRREHLTALQRMQDRAVTSILAAEL